MDLRLIGSAETAPAAGYAHAVEVSGAGRLLFVSGQIARSRDGTTPTGFADQAALVWSNLLAQLQAADMTLKNIVKVTVILSDRANLPEHNRIFDAIIGDHVFCVTTLIAGLVREEWLLEIDAIAAA